MFFGQNKGWNEAPALPGYGPLALAIFCIFSKADGTQRELPQETCFTGAEYTALHPGS